MHGGALIPGGGPWLVRLGVFVLKNFWGIFCGFVRLLEGEWGYNCKVGPIFSESAGLIVAKSPYLAGPFCNLGI